MSHEPSAGARYLLCVVSGTLTVTATIVLLGWCLHMPLLTQWHPALPSMHYNTAAGLLFLAGGLWSLSARRRVRTVLCGLVVFGLGAAVLVPGKMLLGPVAPMTAVCLVAVGLLLLLEPLARRSGVRALQTGLAATVLTVSLSTLLGYLSGVQIGTILGQTLHMALHTAVAFLLVGGSLLLWCWGRMRHNLAIAYVAIAGVLLSMQTFLVFRHAEYRASYAEFASRADDYLDRVHHDVLRDLEAVESVGRLYAASQSVEADEFHAFVEPMLSRLPWIQAIEWMPEKGTAEQPAYPVTYVEPAEGNESVAGFDAASEPMRRAAIHDAVTTGEVQVTGWLPLLERQGKELGFLVFVPVPPHGVVAGVFRTHSAFYTSRLTEQAPLLVVYLADETTPLHPLLYSIGPRGEMAPLPASQLARIQSSFYRDDLISLSGRRWRVICAPTAAWVSAQRTWHPWMACSFGLLLTLLFCLYLRAVTQRSGIVEQQVAQRTQELTEANMLLKQQQATLRENEARFRTLTMHAPVGILLMDALGRCQFVNDAWMHLTGRSMEEARGEGWIAALHPEDAGRIRRLWEEAVATGNIFAAEHRYQRPDGQICWVAAMAVPLRDADGRTTGYIGTVSDITDRLLAEKRHQERQEVMTRVTDAVPGVVYQYQLSKDGTQRFLFVSRGVAAMFGLPAERVLSDFNQIWNLIVPEDMPGVVASIQQSAQTLKPWLHEFRVLTAEGQLKWIRGHSIPEPLLPDGSIVWNGMLLDLTEEKQTQHWLQQLSSVVEQTADIVVITDCHGIIEYVNPSFERQTGYTRAEVVGQTPRLLKSGKHGAAFYEELWHTIMAGRVFRAEIINRRKNGELYYEEQTISPIRDAHGQITHFVSTARDVSSRRQAELSLQQKLTELERFRVVTIDREHRMIELKQRINQLSQELNRPAPFDMSFLPKNADAS